jgi:hypothetical protein
VFGKLSELNVWSILTWWVAVHVRFNSSEHRIQQQHLLFNAADCSEMTGLFEWCLDGL